VPEPANIDERFNAARRDPELAVLEGFHAVKHALRFGADVLEVAIADPEATERLAAEVAPDVRKAIAARAVRVEPSELAALTPRPPATGVVAIARRTPATHEAILADTSAPAVLLEDPRHLGNLGACIRVAAAAGAAGVLSTGAADPWSPEVIRGAAGLQYALPVARRDSLPERLSRPLVALHPEGEDLVPARLPAAAILAFGTERHGLSSDLLARANATVRVPMEPGVSSLNLATTVAAVLFGLRLRA
jgi:RNA methyltransferase, TrmH family